MPDLRTILADLSLTQRAAARLLDVPERTMRRWIADGSTPRSVILALLALQHLAGHSEPLEHVAARLMR
jgi:DNA-binding transcriptional regulator YiaG